MNTKTTPSPAVNLYFRPDPDQPNVYPVAEVLRYGYWHTFPNACVVRLTNGNCKIAFMEELEVVGL